MAEVRRMLEIRSVPLIPEFSAYPMVADFRRQSENEWDGPDLLCYFAFNGLESLTRIPKLNLSIWKLTVFMVER
jgi:hypothetical protein